MNFRTPIVGLLLACAATLHANVYDIAIADYSARGWYDSNGNHSDSVGNYLVGFPGATSYRNFMIFSLPTLVDGEIIHSARLEIYNPPAGAFSGFQSVNPTEVIQLFAVETVSPAQLRLSSTGLTSVFDDLGSGVSYHPGQTVSSVDNGNTIVFELNPAFLSYAQAKLGAEVMIGGALTSNPGSGARAIFIGTHYLPLTSTRLVLTTAAIPEPAAFAAVIGALGLLMALHRRWRFFG